MNEHTICCITILYVCCRNTLIGRVNISDLTWEQKEKVLRYLFGRMNGTVAVTQQSGSATPCTHVLPSLHQTRYV